MRSRFFVFLAIFPFICAQSSNNSLIYQVQDFMWNSTYPPENTNENALISRSVCPFKSGYSSNDAPSVTIIQSVSADKEGCILKLSTSWSNNPYTCFGVGMKEQLDVLCDPKKYRFHLRANWIINSISNGTKPAISKHKITFLIESTNHGPVNVSYDLTIDTTTGLWFPLMGGWGGLYKKTICNDGHFVNGIKVKHDNPNYYFYGMYIRCTDGREILATLYEKSDLVTVQNCASNYPINGAYANFHNSWEAIWGMRFICADKTDTTWRGGIDQSYKNYQICPKGSLVVGTHTYSGTIMDGFSLICKEVKFTVGYKAENQTEYLFEIFTDSPYIYFSGSMFTGEVGYGGPSGIQMQLNIDYGNSTNGTIEIYSSTKKAWLNSSALTLKDLTSSIVRVKLPLDIINGSKLLLDVLATTPIGHSKSLPQKTLLIHSKTRPIDITETSTEGTSLLLVADAASPIIIPMVVTIAVIILGVSLLYVVRVNRKKNLMLKSMKSSNVTNSNKVSSVISSINTNTTSISITSKSRGAGDTTITFDNTLTTTSNGSQSISVPGYLRLDPMEDFSIDTLIGEGGNAKVYKAIILNGKLRSKHGVAHAAIKFINENPNSFMFEIAVMGSIPPSPYIVRMIGYFEDPNGIAMKLYDGTLKDLLFQSDTPLSISHVKQMARDIASGCKLIHSIGLIHFDIKPHNILIERIETIDEFRCAISDFGCTKMIGSGVNSSLVKGLDLPEKMGLTIAYSSPEYLAAMLVNDNMECLEEHKKIDVFAFAVTLFEMIVRDRAWQPQKALELANKIISGERPIFSQPLIDEALKDETLNLLMEIAKESWNEKPDVRPSFDSIAKRLS